MLLLYISIFAAGYISIFYDGVFYRTTNVRWKNLFIFYKTTLFFAIRASVKVDPDSFIRVTASLK